MAPAPVITFLSDFGDREHYVAAVKGEILSRCPEARIVDVTHQVQSHDVLEAAFTLSCCYSCFPAGTIHLVVVDPGVGSARRGLVVSAGPYFFVAPDNGVLSLVYQREKQVSAFSIENESLFRHPVSPTFHGRDVFAPLAARLAQGGALSDSGPEVRDLKCLEIPQVKRRNGGVQGVVLHVDKFGNLITSIRPQDVTRLFGKIRSLRSLRIGDHEIVRQYRHYAEAEPDELFFLLGSSGFLEVAYSQKPAAQLLHAKRGDMVTAQLQTNDPSPPETFR